MSRKVRKFIDAFTHAFSMEKGDKGLDEQDLALVEKLADFVIKRRMAEPALIFLESMRPLNFIGSQAMVFFKPIITTFFSPKDYERLTQILEKRESIDILINFL
ncbi:MAG TPA: hypothetical protein VI387_01390, partial [Candidatus Brocadiales bacterium]|nr:hypothetical protein [Candidatus Brocadiales bacterium]